jgi:hypothetical protein
MLDLKELALARQHRADMAVMQTAQQAPTTNSSMKAAKRARARDDNEVLPAELQPFALPPPSPQQVGRFGCLAQGIKGLFGGPEIAKKECKKNGKPATGGGASSKIVTREGEKQECLLECVRAQADTDADAVALLDNGG